MGWFWASASITPSGSGICGGQTFTADLIAECTSVATLDPSCIFSTDLESSSETEGLLTIDGWGLRDMLSESSTSSDFDIGNGLQVFNDGNLLASNVNVLRFSGASIASSNTINRNEDISVMSPSSGGVISGGDSVNTNLETITGGDAVDTNKDLSGGDAVI